MRIAAGGSNLNPLLKAYFGSTSSTSSTSSSLSKGLNSDAIVSQLGDVKSKLFSLASKAKQLAERADVFQGSEETIQAPTRSETSTTDFSVSISTQSTSGSEQRFDRQVTKGLNRAYASENGKLLKNKRLSGEVNVTVSSNSGEDPETFSIHVDEKTSAKKFVQEFNQKSGGKASAEIETFEVNGKTRHRIKIQGASVTSNTTLTDDDSDNAPQPKISEADAAQFEQEIKKFVTDLNGLVKAVKGNTEGISAIQDNVGLLNSFNDLIKNLKSDDGSVKLSSLLSEKSSGEYAANGNAIRESFLNNTEGVSQLIGNLSDAISGKSGITQSYASYGGNLDKISSVVKLIGKTQNEYRSNDVGGESEKIQAQRQENLDYLVNYAGRLAATKI